MMIEALAMLTLISLVTPTLYKKSAERTTELQDINTASYVRTLMKAVDNYTAANYQSILEKLEANQSDVVNIVSLSEYLPYNYKFDNIKNFDKPIVTIKRQGDTDSITSFVIFPKTGDINDLRASRIASMIGANGGYVDKDLNAKGVGGIWSLTKSELETQLEKCGECKDKVVNGSIVVASSENINEASLGGTENSKYLQRTKTEGEEWRNTMMTDLYMGGTKNILQGTGDIPMSKILGVDQMIIGATKTSDDTNEKNSSLVVKAYNGKEGSAFLEGSLRALGGDFTVSDDEMKFKGLLEINPNAQNGEALFNVGFDVDEGGGMLSLGRDQEGEEYVTINAANTNVLGNFTSISDTKLATDTGVFEVGENGSVIETTSDRISLLGGKMLLEDDGDTSNLHVTTTDVQIDGATTIGSGNEEPLIEDLNPNLTVQGNAFISNRLEAGEIDAHKFDTLELHAGGEDYGTDSEGQYKRWLNADKDGVVIKDLSNPREERLIVSNSETSLYGPLWEDSDDSLYKGAITLGDSEITISGAKTVNISTQSNTGNAAVSLQNGAVKATGVAGSPTGNLVDVRATTFDIKGSDNSYSAFTIIPGENQNNQNQEPERNLSSITSDVDKFVVKKGNNKLLNIVSGENGSTAAGDATAEIDPETFRIWARTPENANDYNPILEVNASSDAINEQRELSNSASVYIRRGAIELEGSPNTSPEENKYYADEGVGYIKASRLVANNLVGSNGNILTPVYADDESFQQNNLIDRYMVNPAYTSVMHDIKLTTRGGARLSDILPDFINKGIYIVTNSYPEGIDFNNLSVSVVDGKLQATSNGTNVENFNSSEWASPFMGVIPTPQCPPGYAKVITLTPASFQMAQAGQRILKDTDNNYYLDDTPHGLEDLTNPTTPITGAEMKSANVLTTSNGVQTSQQIYYLGADTEDAPQPLYFQQSTWLKSRVLSHRDANQHHLGWAAISGFIYPSSQYSSVITLLHANGDDIGDRSIYWNVFPVRTKSIESYATVYCYFDRTNIFEGSGNNAEYVDQYDQLNNFRDPYQKSGNTGGGGNNSGYLQRLNDPQLKYNDPW